MNILVVAASRHGSTREIGEAIALVLHDAGHRVDVVAPEESIDVRIYEAAVLGSAVYMGNWLPEARAFAERNGGTLNSMPIWLFSSGPIGPSSPTVETKRLEESMGLAPVRGHHVFAGKLDKGQLGFAERLAVRMVRAPEGDFRDWDDVRSWAREINAALTPQTVGAL